MGLFNSDIKTIRVKATFPDADSLPVQQEIAVTITVPIDMPAEDLKSVVEAASNWCQKMAESLSAVIWDRPLGR